MPFASSTLPAEAAAPASLAAAGEAFAQDKGMHRRVRLAMYVAFAAIALAALLQGVVAVTLERERQRDMDALELGAQLRLDTQLIARHAAVAVGASNAEERDTAHRRLADHLSGAALAALALQRTLPPRDARSEALHRAHDDWGAVRERLWYRAHSLLNALESADGADRPASALWLELSAETQREADRAKPAARQLAMLLRASVAERGERMERALWLLGGLMLVLLGMLALLVVEPTARAVRRQVRELQRLALDLRRLALVAETTSAMVVLSDRDDRALWTNEAFTRATGWTETEVRGAIAAELLAHPLADPAARDRLRESVLAGADLRLELLCRRRDGAELWCDLHLRALRNASGQHIGFVSVAMDSTQRVAEQRKLKLLWDALPNGVVVQGAGGEIVDANRAACEMLELPREELVGEGTASAHWQILRDDGSECPLDEVPSMRTLRTGQALRRQTVGLRRRGGDLRWLLVDTEPQLDAAGQVHAVIVCFNDITAQRQLQDRLQHSARTDALTGLPNREAAIERVERALAHARAHPGYGFAVMFMDFDRFKQVNDSLGHEGGDELLRQIARRLANALRPGDHLARVDSGHDLAARLGGDEFVVVLESMRDAAGVVAVAERVLADLAEPYTVLDHPVQSSASIGVVHCGNGAPLPASADDVLRDADTAMYEAKRAGRGRWVRFDRAMHDRLVNTLAVERDLRRALRERELFVVYQPVVQLADGSLAGVEGLVRWQHPERGLVSPAEFIPVAEECGLIDAVGQYVLAEACRQFVAWQARFGARAPAQLAVNLSRAQLGRSALVGDVMQVLLEAGMAPSALQLEVTESLAAQDERVQATLRELKARGIRLALDDFGTGYSSLACLHQLPVDTVKVDRSFVKHAETVEYHRVLIEATIRVARTLGMTTVAEGIETEGQAALMRALACDRGQGWLFGRPLAAADLEAWLHETQAALVAP
jgi:diguanylate cyclase (GGDEF)-like protein/PAS domain S-box-containing protein